MNTISERIKMLIKVKEIAEAKTTTRENLISKLNNMIDELIAELDEVSDCETINLFFALTTSFIDYENTNQLAEQIEFVTGCKLSTDKWVDYYIDKRDELTHTEYTTRIILTDESGRVYDIIYATNQATALDITLNNYHAYDGDSVNIQHFNGDDWENVGEYIWRE